MKQILIVDDDHIVRAMLEEIVTRHGYKAVRRCMESPQRGVKNLFQHHFIHEKMQFFALFRPICGPNPSVWHFPYPL